uniref:Ribonuclease P protein component 2 n=1 Tax=Archaeoglobus fulgidus TaxID=2234 RepID=A0A7J2TJ64_ARCFL
MNLPPSMRSRKRYIAFRIIAENSIDKRALWDAMMESLTSLFGEVEALGTGMKLEEFDGRVGIVSCKLESMQKVMIALTLIESVGNEKLGIITVATSGTLKGCRKKLG